LREGRRSRLSCQLIAIQRGRLIHSDVEKIVEPCVALGWASTDLDDFFKALIDQFPNLTILEGPSVTPQQKKRLTESYGRLMGAIKTASGRMLSSFTAAASR
jgi:hypothetical protein